MEANAHKKVLDACHGALCFGVTVLTGKPLRDALDMTLIVKQHYPDLPVVWGGWHPSLFPVEILEETQVVDITVFGQGEVTFKELVTCLQDGADLSQVQGIAYRGASGVVMKNLKRHLVDMNQLAPMDYSLIDVESYFKKKNRRQLDYISSTGCHFRCTFCADPFVYDRAWSGIKPERMGSELAYWKTKYQFTDVNFQDETFFTHRKRVIKIAQQFIDKKINASWAGTLRGDQGYRMSEEEFDLCKSSGLRRVLVGVESGSQEMMDWLKKDIKMEHIWTVAKRCANRNIAVIFPFIVGFPNESDQSVKDSLHMAMQLNSMHPEFTTPIFYFKPYPGSQITQDVVSQGYQLPTALDEWADFDYIGSSGPWVNESKYRLVERFKFYNKVAGRKTTILSKPIQWIAKKRLTAEYFDFPIEKYLADLLIPQQNLS
jgi:radical SAM superfamily enzyme YgiQ (UPF0313 family)